MFRTPVWVRVLVALLLAFVIIVGGYGLYRFGFVQGYQAAAVSIQSGDHGNTTPQIPYYGYPGRGYYPFVGYPFFFPFFGPLIGIGFFFLFFLLLRALFGFGRWGRYGGWHGPRDGDNPPPESQSGPGQQGQQWQ